jgi:hypothetical protein
MGHVLKGMHFSEGGYGRVAEKLLKELNVDIYYVRSQRLFYTICSDASLVFSSNMIQNVLAISRL